MLSQRNTRSGHARVVETQLDETTAWLHNMSAPPKSVVQYGGLSAMHHLPQAPVLVSLDTTARRPMALRFELGNDCPTDSRSRLLRNLGIVPKRTAQAQLDALIDARASELPLPAGCAVIACQSSHRVIWHDLLTVLAILAKCSDTLWLRDKSPSLSSALIRRRVSLLVPALFVPLLPKDAS